MKQQTNKANAPSGYTKIDLIIPTKYIDDLMIKHGGTDVRLAIQHAVLTYMSRW